MDIVAIFFAAAPDLSSTSFSLRGRKRFCGSVYISQKVQRFHESARSPARSAIFLAGRTINGSDVADGSLGMRG